jgi:hypothetical protein
LIERFERLSEFRVNGLAGLRPLGEHREIVALLLERQHQIAVLLQAAPPLQHLLRFGLIFPEIGGRDARLEARQFIGGASGFKDSSGGRQRVC